MRLYVLFLCLLFSNILSYDNLRKLQDLSVSNVEPTSIKQSELTDKNLVITFRGDSDLPGVSSLTLKDGDITIDFSTDEITPNTEDKTISVSLNNIESIGNFEILLNEQSIGQIKIYNSVAFKSNTLSLPKISVNSFYIQLKEDILLSDISSVALQSDPSVTFNVEKVTENSNYYLKIINDQSQISFDSENEQIIVITSDESETPIEISLSLFEAPTFTFQQTLVLTQNEEISIPITVSISEPTFTLKDSDNILISLKESSQTEYEYKFTPSEVKTKSFKYIIDNMNEYTIEPTVKIISFDDTFENNINLCHYSKLTYSITPALKQDISLDKGVQVQINNNDGSEVVAKQSSIETTLNEGSYKICLYYGVDSLPFYSETLNVISPSVQGPLKANTKSLMSFDIEGVTCSPKIETYTLQKDAESLDLNCEYVEQEQKMTCTMKNEWTTSNTFGLYDLQYNSQSIVEGIELTEWNPISIEILSVDGSTTDKKVIITPTNSEDTETLSTITKITFMKSNTDGGFDAYELCSSCEQNFSLTGTSSIEVILSIEQNSYYLESIENENYKKSYKNTEYVIAADPAEEDNGYSLLNDLIVINEQLTEIKFTLIFNDANVAAGKLTSIYVDGIANQQCEQGQDAENVKVTCTYTKSSDAFPSTISIGLEENDQAPKQITIITY